VAARPFAEGETVLLLDRAGNRRLVRLRAGGRVHTHKGSLEHDRLIGEDEGVFVRTSTRAVYVAVRPRLSDYQLEMPRTTAIVYPKDVAVILVWGDIYPGATVLEAGLGSGSLTLALLRAVGPGGQVIVYEARGEFIDRALANIHGFGDQPANLLIRERDIYEGIEDRELDRLVLDLPEPWRVVPHALDALRLGGIAAFYSPSIVQVRQTVEALDASGGFGELETLETIIRPWHVKGEAIRPVQQMVSHTGFLTFARRLAPRPGRREAGNAAPADGAAELDSEPRPDDS
jgi:tRNA (adenine57-N1/adenine58-N1)-methyltransferase catalytic subunit